MKAIKRISVAVIIGGCINLLSMSKGFAFVFTEIAGNNDPLYSSFGFNPSINSEGDVSFFAGLHNGGSGIYKVNADGTRVLVADTNNTYSLLGNAPVISNQGLVAFRGGLKTGGSGIYVGDGGTTTTVANTNQPFGFNFGDPTINQNGTVAFSGQLPNANKGIVVSQGTTTTVADTSNSFSFFNNLEINNADTVIFSGNLNAGGQAIETVNNGKTTKVVDTTGEFNSLSNPVINDAGTIAFRGVLNQLAGEGIYTITNGNQQTIADTNSRFSFFETPTINNQGLVAFKAVLKNGGLGIFTGDDLVKDKIIATGDSLAGSTVTNLFLSKRGLNNNGQLVFYAELADGDKGIFLADPNSNESSTSVPEPGCILGLLTLASLSRVIINLKS